MNQLAPAFVKAKRAFGPALKDKTNPAFRSKYADLGACLDAVEGALLDNGIALYQETAEDSTGVTVETVLLHESGEFLRCGKLHVPAAKQDPQGYGSALTYARRYSLMTACGIAPEDDDGNAGTAAARAHQTERDEWLLARKREIADCKLAGDLKRLLSHAISVAMENNDSDAVDQLNAAAEAKVATAKAKATA
jgi:hypothetical protein